MPKLIFFINFKKDLKLIRNWFPRVREVFGIKKFDSLIKLYYPNCPTESDEKIIEYFKKNKKKILEKTFADGKELEVGWKKIGDAFFDRIEKITGFKWKRKSYGCHLTSSFVCGGSYDEGGLKFVSIFPGQKHFSF